MALVSLHSPALPFVASPAALHPSFFLRGLQSTLTCTKSLLNACVIRFFLCDCRVCVCAILRLVTQETSCLGPSDQPDWSHNPEALRLSTNLTIPSFSYLKYSPMEVYRKIKNYENSLPSPKRLAVPTAAASLNKDRWSSVVWQWVTDIHRHACLFLSTLVFISAWNAKECSSGLMDNNPGYESTRPPSIYTKERWGKSVHVCTVWTDIEICWGESHGLNKNSVIVLQK